MSNLTVSMKHSVAQWPYTLYVLSNGYYINEKLEDELSAASNFVYFGYTRDIILFLHNTRLHLRVYQENLEDHKEAFYFETETLWAGSGRVGTGDRIDNI